MRITLKLFASLAEHLPPGAGRNEAEVEVPDGASVQDVLDRFNLSQEQAHLVTRNGVFVPCSLRSEERLDSGDAVAVWPPVAGG
ncbi:MAG: MoaD/ThiS family protein [Gammaproteobacteria bacterium]|nr:MAG: MoaD/ThiS family protein [Gammaproteobacteria bacterium]